VLYLPDQTGPDSLDNLIGVEQDRTVHVFSSVVSDWMLRELLTRCLRTNALVGIASEGRDWRGWKGRLRQAHSLFHERACRSRVDFVLAIGRVAIKWFIKCGYDAAKLFPFCYAVEKRVDELPERSDSSGVNLSFVGQLIERKRVGLLVESLHRAQCRNWSLSIIGDGKEKPTLEELVCRLKLNEYVHFMGVLDNRSTRRQLAASDVLILPSRWDGWGAVVNEALMSGVPVICSDYCGSADLIQNGFNGEVFRCDSVASLREALQKWISKGQLDNSKREQIQSWSQCIEGEAVARYFLDIIGYLENGAGQRPKAPWLQWTTDRAAQSGL